MKAGCMALILALVMLLGGARAETPRLKDISMVQDRFAGNPRAVNGIGDPFVLPVDDGYHVYATGAGIGFYQWRSGDLAAFERDTVMKRCGWGENDYWAPEVYPWEGRYVMLFTARWSETHTLRIGVAFADSPDGPFEDPLGAPLFDFGYAAIDGTLLVDDEGAPYLIYSRDCSENIVNNHHESHLYGVRLAPDLLGTEGDPVPLTVPDAAWERRSGVYRWNEGPAVLRHDGRYYLFYSANYYADKEYGVGVAVANAPLGPYVKQDNNPLLKWVKGEKGRVLVSGPGHNSFFTVGGELFCAYHTHTYPIAPSGDRQLCVDRAGFHGDGTAYINGPTLAPQLRPLEELGLQNLTASANCAEDPDGLLVDGDICMAKSSEHYVFDGTDAAFTWDPPVTADMLLLWPALDQPISGTATLDGAVFPFSLTPSLPGEAVILPFEPASLVSLRIHIDEGRLGEVLLVGPRE